MRNTLTEIGDTIRLRRELVGILQQQLSMMSGISRRTIQLIENGKANPSVETLGKLIEPLGLTMQLVLKDLSNKDE